MSYMWDFVDRHRAPFIVLSTAAILAASNEYRGSTSVAERILPSRVGVYDQTIKSSEDTTRYAGIEKARGGYKGSFQPIPNVLITSDTKPSTEVAGNKPGKPAKKYVTRKEIAKIGSYDNDQTGF